MGSWERVRECFFFRCVVTCFDVFGLVALFLKTFHCIELLKVCGWGIVSKQRPFYWDWFLYVNYFLSLFYVVLHLGWVHRVRNRLGFVSADNNNGFWQHVQRKGWWQNRKHSRHFQKAINRNNMPININMRSTFRLGCRVPLFPVRRDCKTRGKT